MLYRELPLLERFAAARADGFSAVEILSSEGTDIALLGTAAKSAGVDVVLCNAPMGDFLEGGPGVSAVPGREADFQAAMGQAITMAVTLSCPIVHLGPSRIPTNATKSSCLATLVRNLEAAAELCADHDISVTIEPMNRLDNVDVCLSTVADALLVLDEAGQPNSGLQLDVYHVVRMGDDPLQHIKRHAARIRHIQFADVPGRQEPGSGELDFQRIFETIDNAGYEGYLGAEYLPSGMTSDSFSWFEGYRQ